MTLTDVENSFLHLLRALKRGFNLVCHWQYFVYVNIWPQFTTDVLFICICMRIQFFWDVMLCHWSYSAQHFQEMCDHLVKSQALQGVSPWNVVTTYPVTQCHIQAHSHRSASGCTAPTINLAASMSEVLYPDWGFFRAFSSVVRQMPGYNSQRLGTASTLPSYAIIFTHLVHR